MTTNSTDESPAQTSPVLSGNLRRTVLWLSLPVLMEQFLSFLVGFYDTFLAGKIDANATTAIGLAAYIGWLVSMLFGLVGAGTTALVSRTWGAGEFEDSNRIANRSMALAAVSGVFLYGLIYTIAPLIAMLLSMNETTSAMTVRYLRIDGLGHLFTGVSLVGAATLRGAGNMRVPMIVLGTVSVLNVILSTAFVYGIGPVVISGEPLWLISPMGIDGIVMGTILARLAGGLLMIWVFCRGIMGFQLKLKELRLRGETVRRILRIGGPAAIDGAIMWGGQFLFLIVISHLGTHGELDSNIFAAHIIGIRVEAITYLPATAWGFAAATMIGQSLGAKDPKRAIAAGHEAVLQCGLLGCAITAIFFFGAEGIFSLMHREAAVREIGVPAFRLLAFFQIPLIVSIIYVNALRAAGESRFPMWITVIGVLLFRVPLAWLFGIYFEGGLIGAWVGMYADMTVRGVLSTLRYISGSWTKTKV